jgi:Family of unknown function (DUF6626)
LEKKVQKTIIFETYDYLMEEGLVTSQREFCARWLGKSECYLRTLKFLKTMPSISVLTVFESKLYLETEVERAEQAKLIVLAEKCGKEIKQRTSEVLAGC